MKLRTRARAVALEALYEIDLTNHLPGDVLEERIKEAKLQDELADFAREIVMGVLPITHQLDVQIAKHAPEWPLDQVAVIDRNILRIALWEFAVGQCTPVKVAINEAVELAKKYGSDSSARFVNGVLGSLADRETEIKQEFSQFQSPLDPHQTSQD